MPLAYSISDKAYKDIEKIRTWYDEQSSVAGDRFLDELLTHIKNY